MAFFPVIHDFLRVSSHPVSLQGDTASHPTCPQPGRGSRRAGCPRHRPRSAAGSTRRERRSVEQRGGLEPQNRAWNPRIGIWDPKIEPGVPELGFGTPETEPGAPELGFGTPKLGFGALGLGFDPPKTEPGILELRFGTPKQSLGPQNRARNPRIGFWSPGVAV